VVLGILDIKPENVNRHIRFVESLLHTPDVIGTDVVPSALVITQRPMRGKLNRSSQFRILTKDLIRRGSGEKKDVKDTRLGDPVGLGRLLRGMSDVDPGFGSDGDEDPDGGICRVRVDQGNGSV
jgi:hypothetical protein